MLFDAYCIFGSREFYKIFLYILVEVNKTMYRNYEDVPKKLMDNFHPQSSVRDIPFACVWNVLMADENNSVNQPSMN
jgi:hypothetical protein